MLRKRILIQRSKAILKSLQYETGAFAASKKNVKTGYNKAWMRDNIYITFGLEVLGELECVKKAYAALFDLLLKHEHKIDGAIKEKPDAANKYIHARFCPYTYDEFHEAWGNKQNDAVGLFLYKAGELTEKRVKVIRHQHDLRILQKLVDYLKSIEYWHDKDNGMWENNEEIHASSIGACVAGLQKVSSIVTVPPDLIKKGNRALIRLLPKESNTKAADLALLSLIFPYNVVTRKQGEAILHNVETKLVREKGVIRYFGDGYYNNGQEAEWVKGLAWLAKIYKDNNNIEKYNYYIKKLYRCVNWKGEFPELYYANTNKHNRNTPLGWTQAFFLVAVI